jgi:hypothetical protein
VAISPSAATMASVNHNNQVIDDSVVHEINGAAPISERMAAVGEENQLQTLKKRIESGREIKLIYHNIHATIPKGMTCVVSIIIMSMTSSIGGRPILVRQ